LRIENPVSPEAPSKRTFDLAIVMFPLLYDLWKERTAGGIWSLLNGFIMVGCQRSWGNGQWCGGQIKLAPPFL
jgi:hypothetical protein